MNALEPITQVCPESVCKATAEPKEGFTDALESLVTDSKVVEQHLLLPEKMGVNFPDISQTFGGFGDPGITVAGEDPARTRAREFVAGQHQAKGGAMDADEETGRVLDFLGASSVQPKFDYGHIEKPHYPWNHYPDGTYYGVTSEDFRAFIPDELTWTGNRYVTDRATQAHLLEAGYVDHLLGMIIKRLKSLAVWDESLVVVTADHGGALLTDEPRRAANEATIGEIATVPLFIKSPGQTDYQPGGAVNTVLRQRGTINGAEAGTPLAVAVNSTVVAVGRAFLDAGEIAYSILLPQNSLRTGLNDITIFTVDRTSGEPLLSRLGGTG
ncbi:MAG: sulfatase-like hydrolase/transferase [Thermoleophilia bacterium]|nr:sulfatase-like hydrolase/transferase [Thermoleophilia bacterium]